MNPIDIKELYKTIVLVNAFSQGWKVHSNAENVYFLIKNKKNNEVFDLKKDIKSLHKKDLNVKKQIMYILRNNN